MIKRYNPGIIRDGDSMPEPCMAPSEDGNWVRWEDYEKLYNAAQRMADEGARLFFILYPSEDALDASLAALEDAICVSNGEPPSTT